MRKCRVKKMWFMALLLVVFVAGCGREQGILPPTLTSISPNRGLQGQAVGVTLTGTNFATGATVNVSGSLLTVSNMTVVSSTQITATFTIAANASPGDRTVTVTTSGVTTAAVTFTIAPPLTVSSTSPTNASTSVPIDQPLTATFGEALDCTTVTTSTFTVAGPAGAVTGTIACAGTSATFTPTSKLAACATYTATLTTGIKDVDGDPLASNFVSSFTTGPTLGATAPTVTFTNPTISATGVPITGVPINRKITASFSQAMARSTITTSSFTVTGPGTTSVAGAITFDTTDNIATFTPASNLVLLR